MHTSRLSANLIPLLVAPALIAAACNRDGSAIDEADLLYDGFIGSWTATSFVVSDLEGPNPATDLTLTSPAYGNPYRVMLEFAGDRVGRLRLRHEASGEAEFADTFSVTDVTEHSLTLHVSAGELDETVLVEYLRSRIDNSLTLQFSYPLDLTGEGQRERHGVIAIFQRGR